MKKRLCIILVIALFCNMHTVFAMSTSPSALNLGFIDNGNPDLSVEFHGYVFSDLPTDIISVVMPTQIYFGIYPDSINWNKVISPAIRVTNGSSRPVNISVSDIQVNASGAAINLRTVNPRPNERDIRLGIGVQSAVAGAASVGGVAGGRIFMVGNTLDLGTVPNNAPAVGAVFEVYGDASPMTNWSDGEGLSVSTIFKAEMP